MTNLSKNKMYLAMSAGVAVGATAMATVLNGNVISVAHAEIERPAKSISSISSNDMATLRSLDASFAGLADFVAPSVVHIKSQQQMSRDGSGRLRGMGGQGSGVIFRPDGYIMTNDHVVGGFDNVSVVLNDGREFKGKVIGAPDSDIALVKIDAKDLPAARFGDSGKVKPGQFAMAVGSPFGLENSVTIGHVSGLGRSSAIPDMRLNGYTRVYPDLIQTDASINMGNSGGPLLNVEGEVIGINTAIFSETGGSVGIGFAIPANQARLIAELLIEKGKIERGFLGVYPENLKEFQKKEMNLDGGALVAQDPPNNGPAAAAGIKKGDVIVRIGAYAIRNQLDLRNAMLRYAPGAKIKVEYIRDGVRKTTDLTVAELPEQLRVPKMNAPGDAPPTARQMRPFRGSPEELRKKLEELDKGFPPSFEDMPGVPQERAPQVRPRLGIGIEELNEKTRKQFGLVGNLSGAVITTVLPGSTAAKLGLEPGDVIQAIGDRKINNPQDVIEAVSELKSGQQLRVLAVRSNKDGQTRKSFSVTVP